MLKRIAKVKYSTKLFVTTLVTAMFFVSLFANENNAEKSSTLDIDSVTVIQSNGHVLISWTLNTEVTEGHIQIHRQLESGLYVPLHQVPLDTEFYTDNGANANTRPYAYYVVARDVNGNSFASSKAHKTIHLSEPSYDICNGRIRIQWDNYLVTTSAGTPVPLPSPFTRNAIWMKFSDEPWNQIDDLDFENELLNVLFDNPGEYCFFVQAENPAEEISSSSNIKCLDAEVLQEPEFSYIEKADVLTKGAVEISVIADADVVAPSYVLWRSDSADEEFDPLDTIASNADHLVFIDNNIDVLNNVYYYKTEVLDSCLNSTIYSNVANTMLLSARAYSQNENLLQWNSIEGWPNGVEKYEIYRKTPSDEEFFYLSAVAGTNNDYIDLLSIDELKGEDPVVHYFVLAVENDGNPLLVKAYTASNVASVDREPDVFVPNAFRPDSNIETNRMFKPEFGFFIPLNYEIIIINRWGSVVFKSDDYMAGWDGNTNETTAEQGMYSYIIRWENAAGKRFEKKGVVNLLR